MLDITSCSHIISVIAYDDINQPICFFVKFGGDAAQKCSRVRVTSLNAHHPLQYLSLPNKQNFPQSIYTYNTQYVLPNTFC